MFEPDLQGLYSNYMVGFTIQKVKVLYLGSLSCSVRVTGGLAQISQQGTTTCVGSSTGTEGPFLALGSQQNVTM